MKRDLKLIAEAYEEVGEVKPKLMIPDPNGEWLYWLKYYDHEIHEDGSVSVEGNLIFRLPLDPATKHQSPFEFRELTGNIHIFDHLFSTFNNLPKKINGSFHYNASYSPEDNTILRSLEGGPVYVTEDFDISGLGSITTLKGAPEYVGRDFKVLECNQLNSLKGSPTYVGRLFSCVDNNNLQSLEGSPNYAEHFMCWKCPKIKSLKGLTPGCKSYTIQGFTQAQIDQYFESLELKGTSTGDPTFDDFFGIGDE